MKWRCKVCGYIHEGDAPPAICPLCKADSSKFELVVEKPTSKAKGKSPASSTKWICKVCGYIHEGDSPPDICPVCKLDKTHFKRLENQRVYADTHRLGIARGVDNQVHTGLQALFQKACLSMGQALAMARAAEREGCPEAAEALRRTAREKSIHAARLAELLGEGVTPETAENLRLRVDAELAGCREAKALSDAAGVLGLDEIHGVLLEIAKDNARHGRTAEGLLKRLF
ncbi:MAG: NADH peroxidase [Eubacteriales bacterium]|nr:NADH peroxidase [Eubacteriales bacterium]